jgi:hypothetical protein
VLVLYRQPCRRLFGGTADMARYFCLFFAHQQQTYGDQDGGELQMKRKTTPCRRKVFILGWSHRVQTRFASARTATFEVVEHGERVAVAKLTFSVSQRSPQNWDVVIVWPSRS